MTLPRRALSLLAALASLGASAPALAATPVSKPPVAAAQLNRPAEFHEAQRKAIESANATVGADFIERWFGAGSLQEAKSPMLEGADEAGPYAIEFVKDGSGWKKMKTRPGSAPAAAAIASSAGVAPAPKGFAPASQSARLVPGVAIQAPKPGK